jgi:hypothetical protein
MNFFTDISDFFSSFFSSKSKDKITTGEKEITVEIIVTVTDEDNIDTTTVISPLPQIIDPITDQTIINYEIFTNEILTNVNDPLVTNSTDLNLKVGAIATSDNKIVVAIFDDLRSQILFLFQDSETFCVDYSDGIQAIPCQKIGFLNE